MAHRLAGERGWHPTESLARELVQPNPEAAQTQPRLRSPDAIPLNLRTHLPSLPAKVAKPG
jgi:hypothetical protein